MHDRRALLEKDRKLALTTLRSRRQSVRLRERRTEVRDRFSIARASHCAITGTLEIETRGSGEFGLAEMMRDNLGLGCTCVGALAFEDLGDTGVKCPARFSQE